MPRKKTQQEFEAQVTKVNPDIDLSDFIYVNSQTKGIARCKKCGNEWMVVANSLMLGIGCRKCFDKRNSESRKQPLEEVQRRVIESGSNATIIGEYIDTKHTCLAKCKDCGYEWHPCTAMDLVLGHGCPKCANQLSGLWRKYSPEQMLDKIREKYKDSQFTFEHKEGHQFNVICPIHGAFTRSYDSLMHSNATCMKCKEEEIAKNRQIAAERKEVIDEKRREISEKKKQLEERKKRLDSNGVTSDIVNPSFRNRLKSSRDEIIASIETLHPGKFDFSKFEWNGVNRKSMLICKDCGYEWEVAVWSVLNGVSCPNCRGMIQTTESWVAKAREKRTDKEWDYSKVEYVNQNTEITIGCPDHGYFQVPPKQFLSGAVGCPECGRIKLMYAQRLPQEEVIRRLKETWGDTYDFSKFVYDGMSRKGTVICKKHGEFDMTPANLLSYHGCPICSMSRMESLVRTTLIKEGINFELHKHFPEWLGRQEVDFYLPDHHVAIEVQGIQHFEAYGYTSEEDVMICKERDERKKRLCRENGLPLVYYFHDKRLNRHMSPDDTYFNDIPSLLAHIRSLKKPE